MILELPLIFGIKSKIVTDDLGPEETGYARARSLRLMLQTVAFQM